MTIQLPPLPAPWVSAGEFYHDTPDFYVIEQLHTAQREAALAALEEARMAVRARHAEQTINNQEYPSSWHQGIAAAYEAIRALCTELENAK